MTWPQISIALWLALAFGSAIGMAFNPRRPFVFCLDRAAQQKVLLGMAAGSAIEAVTLWLGGFWS